MRNFFSEAFKFLSNIMWRKTQLNWWELFQRFLAVIFIVPTLGLALTTGLIIRLSSIGPLLIRQKRQRIKVITIRTRRSCDDFTIPAIDQSLNASQPQSDSKQPATSINRRSPSPTQQKSRALHSLRVSLPTALQCGPPTMIGACHFSFIRSARVMTNGSSTIIVTIPIKSGRPVSILGNGFI